jgi:hypothetical protein
MGGGCKQCCLKELLWIAPQTGCYDPLAVPKTAKPHAGKRHCSTRCSHDLLPNALMLMLKVET